MITQDKAIKAQYHALKAIEELSKILLTLEGEISPEEYANIKKTIGVSIGRIQVDILDLINKDYPEINTL